MFYVVVVVTVSIVYRYSGGLVVPHGMTATMLLIVMLEDRLGVSPVSTESCVTASQCQDHHPHHHH